MSTETIDTTTVEHIIKALSEPPAPAAEVVTLGRQMAERILSWLEDHPAIAGIALSTCEEVSVLRQALAEPKVELWAIHSVGPGEVYPCLSKEHAEREAKELFEQGEKMKADRIARGESVEHWHDWVTNVIPSPWEPAEHFEILAGEIADHRKDLIARLEELEKKSEPAPAQDEREIVGVERYRVEPTGRGFWPFCVRAGDGTRELFVGHRKACERVAAELVTAFEDGRFVASSPAQTEQQQPVAFRILRKRTDGLWATDGRPWVDGVPDSALLKDITERSDGWRLIYAYAAPIAQTDPWQPSGADYDRAIHANPDAKAWADLFVETFPGLADKHDLMIGWFANAMMAMHDHLARKAVPQPEQSELADTPLRQVELRNEVICELYAEFSRGGTPNWEPIFERAMKLVVYAMPEPARSFALSKSASPQPEQIGLDDQLPELGRGFDPADASPAWVLAYRAATGLTLREARAEGRRRRAALPTRGGD